MATQLAFLALLDLDEDADERAIRRSYARKLKQIDQAADAAGFQSLREAYETALQWASWKQQQQAQAPQPQPEAPAAEEVPASARAVESRGIEPVAEVPPVEAAPEVAARAVFGDLMARLAASSSAAGWSSDTLHRSYLKEALDDPRLISIAARDIFEWFVAELLAGGWRPGHEALMVAASRVFGWQEERQRLARFGRVGEILNRAITERAVFDSQPDAEKSRQRNLIARLRDPSPPSHGELIAQMALVEWLAAHFSILLHVITSTDNLQCWRELDRQVPAWKRKLSFGSSRSSPRSPSPRPPADSGINWRWSILFGVFMVIRAMTGLSGDSAPEPVPRSERIAASASQTPQAGGGHYPGPGPGAAADPPRPLPPPVPPSKAQLSALVHGKPTAEKCNEVGRLASDFKIGTPEATKDFGAAYDRQVIGCVNARLWPRNVYQDPAILAAIQRERQRSAADMAAINRELAKLPKVTPARTEPVQGRGLYPSHTSALADSAFQVPAQEKQPRYAPVQPWTPGVGASKYRLEAKDIKLKATE